MRKQQSFPNLKRYSRLTAGGTSTHEKYERPLSRKHLLHLVLKSAKARDEKSFHAKANRGWIKHLLDRMAGKFGIKICDYANVGTHLHLKLKIGDRELFRSFIRSVAGMIASRQGSRGEKFWTQSPFSRVLKTAYEDLGLKGYFEANRIEAARGYEAREEYRQEYNSWLQSLKHKSG